VRPLLGTPTRTIRVFVSSGDDALELRDFVDDLVANAINAVLMQVEAPIRFEVDRWERSAPHKVLSDASPNEEFVARAVRADLVVCILFERLGTGTREELEAALTCGGVELSVIWCAEREGREQTPVGAWLKPRTHDLLWDFAGTPDTTGPTVALVRVFLVATLSELRDGSPEELLRERR
jgi:hypothetical protein